MKFGLARLNFIITGGAIHFNCIMVILLSISEYYRCLLRNVALKLGLNENSGYASPNNRGRLGQNFLYFGFIPSSIARSRSQQGLQVCNTVTNTLRRKRYYLV